MAIATSKSINVDILFCGVIGVFVIAIYRVVPCYALMNKVSVTPSTLHIVIGIIPSKSGYIAILVLRIIGYIAIILT